MRNYVTIGCCPVDEPCVQVSSDTDYLPAMQQECIRYIGVLRQKFGSEPPETRLAIRSNLHEFGTYLEVVCYFDDDDGIGRNYAYRCEAEAPHTWEDILPSPDYGHGNNEEVP